MEMAGQLFYPEGGECLKLLVLVLPVKLIIFYHVPDLCLVHGEKWLLEPKAYMRRPATE